LRAISLLFWIALGGALGAVSRVLLTALVNQLHTGPWKLGTLAVNLLGCFLFGFIWAKADMKMQLEGPATIAILGGFIGSLTTFSTFMFQTTELTRQSDYVWAAANLLTHNGLGIAMVFLGLALAKGVAPAVG